MLVSILVDRYQRVFTRKLYTEPENVDFDDFSDEDKDSIERGVTQNDSAEESPIEDQLEEMMQNETNDSKENSVF